MEKTAMRHRRLQMYHSSRADAAVFGVAFNSSSSKRSAFREATLDVLSEHASESEARATACSRNDAALKRRMSAQPLTISATPRLSSLSAELP
jgi:hypothetical protein